MLSVVHTQHFHAILPRTALSGSITLSKSENLISSELSHARHRTSRFHSRFSRTRIFFSGARATRNLRG